MSSNEIEEVKQRLDLVELVGQYVTLKKAGSNYKAQCPFHQEKTASLMVSPEKQIWKCFGCSLGGDIYKFVMQVEHLEFGDALRMLAQKAGVTLQSRTRSEYQTQDSKSSLYQINRACAKVFQTILLERDAGKAALEYLRKRGIKVETIKQFAIGYAPKNFDLKSLLLKHGFTANDLAKAGSPERFFDRIMFPIFDVLSNPVGFTGRILGEGEPKYLNSPETPIFNKSRVLYGLNLAKAALKEKNYVILVEGQMDVVALHQAGVTNAVASSGTAITETQLVTLSKYTPNFLLAFDNDTAGKATTKKVIEMLLRLDLNSKVIDFGKYKDAGELFEKDKAAWAPIVKEASEGVEWWIAGEIAVAGQLDFIENKKKVIKAMLPILGLITDPTRLDHYAQRLALAVGVKTDSVYESVKKVSQPPVNNLGTKTDTQKPKVALLTNEEQFLALAIAKPALIVERKKDFDEVIWQSVETVTIAESLKKLYTDTTLVKSPTQFLSKVKNTLGPDLEGKIDSWQFWVSQEWPELTDETAKGLIDEKISRLATGRYDLKKENLARAIKRAQVAGDINEVKKLMSQLSDLTAKGV
ncbi:MAG: DNA primase [Candidatus Berkelbacteria bacterium]|nr:DNA primase [Candidatus Berkelbacteria bacterium]